MRYDFTSLDDFYKKLSTSGFRQTQLFQVKFKFNPDTEAIIKDELSNLRSASGKSKVDFDFSNQENFSVFAQTINIPGITQNTTTIRYQGFPFKFPSTIDNSPQINMTVRCDQNSYIRDVLLAWRNYHKNLPLGFGIGYPEGLLGPLTLGEAGAGNYRLSSNICRIILLNEDFDTHPEKPNEEYMLVGVVPTLIGDLNVDTTAAELLTFETTFQFQYYFIRWKHQDGHGDDGHNWQIPGIDYPG